MTIKLAIWNFVKMKYKKIFTTESSVYQSLNRKNLLIAVILSKNNFGTKLLHVYNQCVCIVKGKYQIVLPKAVVGVDRPMKALSIHIQKPDMGKFV